MRVMVFSTKPYDEKFLRAANREARHALRFYEARLTAETARLAQGSKCVCASVTDDLGAEVIAQDATSGVRLIALRSAGFNHVDLEAVWAAGLSIARVPAYSPHAVAEHTVALILALNRRSHCAYNRVREGNFALDGFLGFDLHGKTVGVVGTGLIGGLVARSLSGFGCEVLAHDPRPNPDCLALGVTYTSLEELLGRSDVVTLQCPLTPQTRHLINDATIAQMKRGTMLVNTSRGRWWTPGR